MTEISRREFTKEFGSFLAGAMFAPLISGCSKSEEKLAFLRRINDDSFAEVEHLSSEKIEQQSTIHEGFHDIGVIEPAVDAEIRRKIPNLQQIKGGRMRVLGFHEPSEECAETYKQYIEEITTWAKRHQALQELEKPSLEVMVTGRDKRRTSNVPVFVEFTRVQQYSLDVTMQDGREGNLKFNSMSGGGVVRNLFNLKRSDESIQLKLDSPMVHLTTSKNDHAGLLTAPLSEYLPLMMKEGMKRHFEVCEKEYEGKIPNGEVDVVSGSILICMEAVSEAAAASLTIEYLQRNKSLLKELPSDINGRIRKSRMIGINKDNPMYQFVPGCFLWMEKEGVRQAVDLYMNNIEGFVGKMKEYQAKVK